MLGKEVCHMHGGKSKGNGIINHGRRSKALEGFGWAAGHLTALEDPELLSSRENIATLEAMICSTLEGNVPPLQLWKEANKLYTEGATNSGATDQEKVAALRELGGVLKRGVTQAKAMEKAVELMESQRRHKESESRREDALQTTLNVHQANVLNALWISLFEEFVPRERLPEAGQRINTLLTRATSGHMVRAG